MNYRCTQWLTAALNALLISVAGGATAQEKVTVRMDFLPAGTHAPFHLAVAKGWYREAGLDVEVQDGRGSINTIQLVGAGQADFGWVSLGPMAIAREQGMRLKAVAGVFRRLDARIGILAAAHQLVVLLLRDRLRLDQFIGARQVALYAGRVGL